MISKNYDSQRIRDKLHKPWKLATYLLIPGTQKSAACQGTLFKEKDKFLYLTQLTHEQRGTIPAELLWMLVISEATFHSLNNP